MEEEVDPILSKLNGPKQTSSVTQPTVEEDPILKKLNSRVKKKDVAEPSSSDGTTTPGLPASSQPAEQQSTPSEKPTVPAQENGEKEQPTARSQYEERIRNLQSVYQGRFEDKVREVAQTEQKDIDTKVNAKRQELQDKVNAGYSADLANKELDEFAGSLSKQANEKIGAFQQEFATKYSADSADDLNKWVRLYTDEFQRKDWEENKIRNPLTSLGKSAWTTMRYQMPADVTSGMANLMLKAPYEASKAIMDPLMSKAEELLPGFAPEVNIKESPVKKAMLDAYRTAAGLSEKAAEENKYLVNTLDKAQDFVDYINWAGSALGQAAGQIPAAVLTRGGTAIGQEVGSIYMDGVNRIANEKGITPEEVIKQGLDESLYPVVFGTAAGALETLGAKGTASGLLKTFGEKEIMGSLRGRALASLGPGSTLRAGITEATTEGAQSVLEQIGAQKAAGKTFMEALRDIDPQDVLESYAQGFIGGTGLHATGSAIRSAYDKITAPAPLKDVIRDQVKSIDIQDLSTAKQAAAVIQNAVRQEGEPKVEPAPVVEAKVEPVTKEETAKEFQVGITSATDKIPEIKGLMEQARQFESEGKFEERDKVFQQVLDLGEKTINELLAAVPGAKITLQRTMGDFFNYTEPTFKGTLEIEPGHEKEAFAALATAGQQMKQDAIHISDFLPQTDETVYDGQEDADGAVLEPNIDIFFDQKMTPHEVSALKKVVQGDAELAGFTLHPDGKGINLYNISKFTHSGEFLEKILKIKEDLDRKGIRFRVERNTRRLRNIGSPEAGATRTYDQIRGTDGGQQEIAQPAAETPSSETSTETQNPPTPAGDNTTPAADENQLSGIKKALVPEDKVSETQVDKRSNKQVFDQAKSDVDTGKINPQSIVDDVVANGRALQPHEVASLVYYKGKLDNQIRDANERLANGDENAKAELESLTGQLDKYHEMAVISANQQSMAFRMRKLLIDSEYNLQSQVNQYKALNNGEIPQEVLEKYQRLDQELKAANQKIEHLQNAAAEKETNAALSDIALRERQSRRKTITKEKKVKISSFFDSLKADTSNKGMLSASVLPGISLLPHVWNGSVEVVKQAVLTGLDISTAIQNGIDYIKTHHQGEFDEEAYRKGMTPLLSKAMRDEETPEPSVSEDGKVQIPNALIKDLVASGLSDINSLTDEIHSMLVKQNPDVTKREVRDAITKYGKTSTMSQQDIDVKIRGLKRIGRMLSQLEDALSGKRPERSGLQRDKPTDEERRLRQQVDEAMKELPPTKEEEDRVLKTALDRVKSRLTNQIADLEHQIETGEKAEKKKGIEYDEEAKKLAAKRDELRNILNATKEGQSDEQRIKNAIKATERSLEEYQRRIRENDLAKTAKKPLSSAELDEVRSKRQAAKEELERLRKESGMVDKERIEIRKKAVRRAMDDYQRRIREKDFGPRKKPDAPTDPELQKMLRERERIKEEFDLEQERARLKNRPMSEKVKDFAIDVINVPKSLLSSLDLSAALRQGGYLLPTHPIKWAKGFVDMLKMAASEKYYNEWHRNLKASELWPLIQSSKLFIADNNARISAREEQFMSKLARKVPIIGQSIKLGSKFKIPGLDLIGASNRAYSGFLNSLRAQVFAAGVDHFQQQGKDFKGNEAEYKALADFINNATGRGKLAGKLENAAPVLNTLFFSPRFMASRLNLLNPTYYAKMPASVRQKALISTLSYIAFVSAIGAIGAAADWWEIELDPRSTDFGKFRIGDTRFDPWGGFQTYVRTIAQLATGQKKTSSGEIKTLNSGKFNDETRLDIATRFMRGKLSPVPGSVVNLLSGKNMVGEPVTVQDEALRNVVPLYIQDMKQMFEKRGSAEALKTLIPTLFGIGVQYYEPRVKVEPTLYEKIIKRVEKATDIGKKIDQREKQIEKVY